jgi:hydroxymethylglutaryl-CoA lyase
MVEGSICGIGGGIAFPGGTGSVGNLPSEDIVQFLNVMGIETGIEIGDALAAARDVAEIAGIPANSRLVTIGTREDAMHRGANAPAAHPG